MQCLCKRLHPHFPPCAAQMQTQVQVPLFLIVVHCPQPLLLLSCCAAQWIRWGLHGLLVNIRVWAGWRATIRVRGSFWCAAWITANNGYHSSTGSPLRLGHLCVHNPIFSLVMAALDPVPHWHGAKGSCRVHLAQAGMCAEVVVGA